jgi:hypothetical protein
MRGVCRGVRARNRRGRGIRCEVGRWSGADGGNGTSDLMDHGA